MTFCIGIKVDQGLVALADTQIVLGSERVSQQKLAALYYDDDSLFAVTSGLRSVRDKAIIYLDEELKRQEEPISRLFQVANLFGEQLRRVRQEDGPSLAASGLKFNPNAIISGHFRDDSAPQLFYVYPEGNWIEAAADSPYFIIGRTTYGKPILDRLLRHDTTLKSAVALALLAFDSTRASVTDSIARLISPSLKTDTGLRLCSATPNRTSAMPQTGGQRLRPRRCSRCPWNGLMNCSSGPTSHPLICLRDRRILMSLRNP